MQNEGRFVNVHSAAYPSGEIRAQIAGELSHSVKERDRLAYVHTIRARHAARAGEQPEPGTTLKYNPAMVTREPVVEIAVLEK